MTRWLPVLLIGVPLVELYLLVLLGRQFGAGPVLALLVLSALLGSTVARLEGLRVWRDCARALYEGRSPAQSVLEGVLVLVGAGLLILPGVLTDVLGLLLLFPPSRRAFARPLRRFLQAKVAQGSVSFTTRGFTHARFDGPGRGAPPNDVVDTTGEAVRDDELPPPSP